MKILVIDKDVETRTVVRTRLEARGYHVHEEWVSEKALRFLSRESVDLILLSSVMEHVDGKYLIDWIRKTAFLNSVPVIMMTREDDIAELVLSQSRGFDDFLLKPFSPLVLQLRVAMNIEKTRSRIEANALTQLPGNATIERVVVEKIEANKQFSVVYLDINHFKSFNDRYGFKRGDDAIRQTAKILVSAAQEVSNEEDAFVGHIGGDDFVSILHPDDEELFAEEVIKNFDRIMPTYYSDEDRLRGEISVTNRKGKQESFPIMSVSIAACTNLYKEYKTFGEIAQDAAELKGFLKSQIGSYYLRDRRSAPVENIEEAIKVLNANDRTKQDSSMEEADPLGKTLLRAGLITEEQLGFALQKNMESGKRLGEILISMRVVKSEDVGKMLEKKLNVPYFQLVDYRPDRDTLRLFTNDFIRSRRIVPVESSEEGLKLAMCDPFDLKTLDAIERITQLKPVPLLALEEEFEDFMDRCLPDPDGPSREKTG